MQSLMNRLLIFATVLLFAVQASATIVVDLNIEGIYTDATFETLVPGSSVDPGGNEATATLAAGQGILLLIDISNLNGDEVSDIFSTVIFQGDQLGFLGGAAVPEVLVGGPVFAPTSLGRVAQPAIKINTPNPQGAAGDVWAQSTAYASVGTDGTGPDNVAVQLFFEVTGALGSEQVFFDLTTTAGDVISGSPILIGAAINVPEPGSLALGMASLGAIGLVTRIRRRV
jgi:hypothetical protein